MKNEDIPALIRELRQRLDLTQEQFAREVGVTFSTVNLWENGHRCPQPYLMKRLLEMEASLEQGLGTQQERGVKPKRGR